VIEKRPREAVLGKFQASQHEFAGYVERGEYGAALEVANREIKSYPETIYWLKAKGLLGLANPFGIELIYTEGLAIYQCLVTIEPDSADNWFWLGYMQNIAFGDLDSARSAFKRALDIDVSHPYANLALAGLTDNPSEALGMLNRVLDVQPGNCRALQQKLEIAVRQKDVTAAQECMDALRTRVPFVEAEYGFMNEYVNSVLTLSNTSSKVIAECESLHRSITR
jgi:tetratricopeptide (TPR) repeat protein